MKLLIYKRTILIIIIVLFIIPNSKEILALSSTKKAGQTTQIVIAFKSFISTNAPTIFLDTLIRKNIVLSQYPEAIESLKSIKIASSPQPGKKKTIPIVTIKNYLKKAKFPPNTPVLFKFPKTIVVQRTSQKISKETIKKLLVKHLRLIAPLKNTIPKVKWISYYEDKNFPDGKLSLTIEKKFQSRLIGLVNLPITVSIDGNYHDKVWIRGETALQVPCIVANRVISRGSIVKYEHINTKYIEIKNLSMMPLQNNKKVVGKRLKKTILADHPFFEVMLETMPIIKKGQRVTISVRGKGILITIPGVTMEDGWYGKWIKVHNNRNKKLRAKVISPKQVEILL